MSRHTAVGALNSWFFMKVLISEKKTFRIMPEVAYRLNPRYFAYGQLKALLTVWLAKVQPEYLTIAKTLGQIPRKRLRGGYSGLKIRPDDLEYDP